MHPFCFVIPFVFTTSPLNKPDRTPFFLLNLGFSEQMERDSTIEVQRGNVQITVPLKHKFLINASAPRTNIAPRLLNKGEIFLSQINKNEIFTTSASSRSDINKALGKTSVVGPTESSDDDESAENLQPTLTVIVHEGSISMEVKQTREEINVEKGFDSAS